MRPACPAPCLTCPAGCPVAPRKGDSCALLTVLSRRVLGLPCEGAGRGWLGRAVRGRLQLQAHSQMRSPGTPSYPPARARPPAWCPAHSLPPQPPLRRPAASRRPARFAGWPVRGGPQLALLGYSEGRTVTAPNARAGTSAGGGGKEGGWAGAGNTLVGRAPHCKLPQSIANAAPAPAIYWMMWGAAAARCDSAVPKPTTPHPPPVEGPKVWLLLWVPALSRVQHARAKPVGSRVQRCVAPATGASLWRPGGRAVGAARVCGARVLPQRPELGPRE